MGDRIEIRRLALTRISINVGMVIGRYPLISSSNKRGEPTRSSHDHEPAEEKKIREAALDQTIEASFPASDPPSTDPNPDDEDALESE